jgi:hypothetical protein
MSCCGPKSSKAQKDTAPKAKTAGGECCAPTQTEGKRTTSEPAPAASSPGRGAPAAHQH